MQDHRSTERRAIFQPYSQNTARSNIYVCVGCGMHFILRGDMGELAMRFAEHLCEPIWVENGDPTPDFLTH